MQNVKSFGDQLEWFTKWQKEVVSLVGQERGEFIINNTLCITSTGANDYVNNYYLFQVLRTRFTPEEYTTFLLGKARAYIQVRASDSNPNPLTPFEFFHSSFERF